MPKTSKFNKRLKEILTDFAEAVRLITLYPNISGEVEDPEEAIKQAISDYIIGDFVSGSGDVYVNAILEEQRRRLWGDTHGKN